MEQRAGPDQDRGRHTEPHCEGDSSRLGTECFARAERVVVSAEEIECEP